MSGGECPTGNIWCPHRADEGSSGTSSSGAPGSPTIEAASSKADAAGSSAILLHSFWSGLSPVSRLSRLLFPARLSQQLFCPKLLCQGFGNMKNCGHDMHPPHMRVMRRRTESPELEMARSTAFSG